MVFIENYWTKFRILQKLFIKKWKKNISRILENSRSSA